MNRKQILLLAVALLAGLLAAFLSLSVLRQPAPQPEKVVEKLDSVEVAVVAKKIERGDLLAAFTVEWRNWPRVLVTPEMITKEEQPNAIEEAKTARARLPMVPGEPLLESKLIRPGEKGFLTALLPKGRRAISIPISEASAVSGFIIPNDRVDVVLTNSITSTSGARLASSQVILRNVKVLAINQTLHAGADGTTVPDGRNAVLELDPKQAQVVLRANAAGNLSLVLRSIAEGGEDGFDADTPVLDSMFSNPQRADTGTLVVRYGREQNTTNR